MLHAEATVFITAASVLSVFDIKPIVESGDVCMPVAEQTSGFVT